MSTKVIDYLVEDPELPSQKYALISIVGPHMKQKCDVWGLKIRGVADSMEAAKAMTVKLMKGDKDFDIYTVSVGKFFPLAVEPLDVQKVEYQNEQLNSLVKSYMENKEKANEHWQNRKSEMMKEALREGKSEGQKELANKPEHPIVVLQRIKSTEDEVKELEEKLSELTNSLKSSKEKYDSYTEEEKKLADDELRQAIEQNVTPKVEEKVEPNIEEIRNEIMQQLQTTSIEDPIEQKSKNKAVNDFINSHYASGENDNLFN